MAVPILALGSCARRSETETTPTGPGTDWTQFPSGMTPSADPYGVPLTYTPGPGASRLPTTGDGLNGNLPDQESASYVVQDLGHPVREIGAVARFDAGSADGALCVACWERWPPGPGAVSAPDAVCHLSITRESWWYGVFRSGALTIVGQGDFDASDLTDKAFTVRVQFDSGRAALDLPGLQRSIDDFRVRGTVGNFPCWEFYKAAPGASDVVLLRTWAV
jgi:hypothetical protein